MADIASLATTSSYPAPAAATTPAPAVADFASPPPQAALAAAGTIVATVLGGDAGAELLLKTDFGTLALKTPLVLAAGTSLELKLFAGPPASAAILSIDGAPLGSGALRSTGTPSAADTAVPAPSESVELGQTVRATVLAPESGADAPAAGTSLSVRVLSAATPSAMNATVLQSAGSTTVVATPLGKLALEAQIEAAPGTLLSLERIDRPTTSARAGAKLPASPALGTGWPALDEALQSLDRTVPELAATLREDLTPAAAPRLAATLMFFMGVLRGGAAWPGEQLAAALGSIGRGDLRARLAKDIDDLRAQARESSRGDWRIFTLPLLDEGAVRPIRLYLRNRSDGGGTWQDERGARFVVDLDLTRLGPLQLDGLVRRGRFDLVLRSHTPVTAEMKAEIGAIFRAALEGSGFSGDIAFVTASRFPVAPLEALRPHVGVEA